MISAALQTALYQKLNGTVALTNLVTGIYDVVPEELTEENPQPEIFPYIVIGSDEINSMDTDTEVGFDTTITIDIFTRVDNLIENKQIRDVIFSALHHQNLNISGFNTLTLSHIKTFYLKDADGLSQHGVISFRFLADII